ncbi:MAG: MTAP family purine nucleoside phosphorylase [Planctomycetes bacterium]|nr:MTAP family purine nucleoside phosphorylase [Planctomycetota bacterium]
MEASVACIGGTAAYDLLRDGAFLAHRLGPQDTPFGESQPIFACESRFGSFYFLSPSFVNYRANIYALKSLGTRAVFSWSETRAISHNYKIGQFVVVSDLIDETHSRPRTFFENQGLGVVRQWPVFCPSLSNALMTALGDEMCRFSPSGTYVCIEGPRRETPAEVRKYAAFGAELLGMTLSPEVFLAKELQMCYASVAFVAGYAETGSDFRPFENGRILDAEQQAERAAAAVEVLPRVLERLIDVLHRTPGMCACENSMQHHIASGQIGWDWRTWFDEERPVSQNQPPQNPGASFPSDFIPFIRRPAGPTRGFGLRDDYPYEDHIQP